MKAPKITPTRGLRASLSGIAITLFLCLMACDADLIDQPVPDDSSFSKHYTEQDADMRDTSQMQNETTWEFTDSKVESPVRQPESRKFLMEKDWCTRSSFVLSGDNYTMTVIINPGRPDLISLRNFGGFGDTVTAVLTENTIIIPHQGIANGDRTLTIQGRGNFSRHAIYLSYVLSQTDISGNLKEEIVCSTQGTQN